MISVFNKIIDVCIVANRFVSITVENPDFSNLRIDQFVMIGERSYKVRSIPFFHSNHPYSILERNTFLIDLTEDELIGKYVLI